MKNVQKSRLNLKSDLPPIMEYLIAFCLFVSIYILYNPAILSPFSYILTSKINCTDKYVHLWNYFATCSSLDTSSPFWTNLVFYPYGTSLTYHSSTLLYGFIYCICNRFVNNIDIILFNNTILFLTTMLTFAGGFLIGKIKRLSFAGSFFVAFIFAFSYARFSNITGHWNIFSTGFLPFAMIGLLLIDTNKNWCYLLFFTMMALTFWLCVQLGSFLAIIFVIFIVFNLIKGNLSSDSRKWLFASLLVFMLMTGPLFVSYFNAALNEGVEPDYNIRMQEIYSSQPYDFLIPHDSHLLRQSFFSGLNKSNSYIGVVMIFLCVFLVFRKSKIEHNNFWLYLAIFFWILSLGPSIFGLRILPGRIFMYIPPFSIFRTPYRYAIPMIYALAVFLAPIFEKRNLIYLIIIPILILDFYPSSYKLEKLNPRNRLEIVMNEDGSVLNIPFGIRHGLDEYGLYAIKSQYYQIYHKKPMLDGYVARVAVTTIANQLSYPILREIIMIHHQPNEVPEVVLTYKDAEALLEQTNLRYIIVHHYRSDYVEINDFFIDIFKQVLEFHLIYSDEEITVYKLSLRI